LERLWSYRIKKNPLIAITFHKKYLPLVKYISKYLRGSLRIKEKENAVVLLIRKNNDIILMVN
jgi:hypothetical protein